MPGKFLNANELYRLFQRELPEGVYPDSGAPSAYFSTSSAYAKSVTVESLYSNMARIYDNYFPQLADEKLDDWEVTAFGAVQGVGSLADRRQRVINKLRSLPKITLWEMLTTVLSYVPVGTFVQIVPYQTDDGVNFGWRLGVSRLGSETMLGWGYAHLGGYGGAGTCSGLFSGAWSLGHSSLGVDTLLGGPLTYQQFVNAQNRAYGYEVRIFGVTLDPVTRAALDADLKAREPARSSHVILDGLNIVQYNLTVDVSPIDQTSLVNTAKVDNTASTGYSGRVRA